MVKSKEQHRISRADFAQKLRRIADMVESGSVHVGDTSIDLPDNMEYDFELEEDQHEGKLEVEVEWAR